MYDPIGDKFEFRREAKILLKKYKSYTNERDRDHFVLTLDKRKIGVLKAIMDIASEDK